MVKEIQGLGRKAFAFTADVSNLQEVQNLVQASVAELGPINTMVANAGIAQVKALLDLTEQDLKRMFEVNGIPPIHTQICHGLIIKQFTAYTTATPSPRNR